MLYVLCPWHAGMGTLALVESCPGQQNWPLRKNLHLIWFTGSKDISNYVKCSQKHRPDQV